MKKIYLLLTVVLGSTNVSIAQCAAATAYASGNAPASGANVNITTCAYAGEYSAINNVTNANDYTVTYTGGTGNYVTIYDNGLVPVAWGLSPVSFTATYTGTYYSQANIDAGCGTDVSCHTANWANTTPPPPCPTEIAPWTEPFTTTVDPPCWTQSVTSGGPWAYTGNPGYSVAGFLDHTSGVTNNYAWMDFSGTDVGVILTTPEIDVTALTNVELRFWQVSHYTGALDPYNSLFVEAWDGAAWQPITENVGETGAVWVEYYYNLTPYIYSGNLVQVRFRAESGGASNDYNNDILLDDVSVIEGPTCPEPGALTAGTIGIASVDLNWLNGGFETAWIIEYGLNGFSIGSGTQVSAGTNPFTLTGLTPDTTYDIYVYADCGGGDISLPVGPITILTLELCPTPTGPTSAPALTDAMLSWTAGGTEIMWDVEYGLNGFTLGSGTQNFALGGLSTTATPLTGSTDYHWYVRAVCDISAPYDTVSLWIGPELFTTGQICTDPSALDTVNSDPFNNALTWSPGGSESEWNVQWGLTGFVLNGGGTTVNGVTVLPESLTGLVPGETYDYYVQSVCGSSFDSLSIWVGPFTWTQPTFCSDPGGGTFSNLTTISGDFSWTAGGTETNWTVEYGLNGFALGSGTSIAETSTTTSVTGLTTNTDYCFYVQANCGSTQDSSSAWIGPFCVTTLTSCPEPINLNVTNITNTATTLLWQAGGTELTWNIEWGNPGFTAGAGEELGSEIGTGDNPFYVTGLNESAPYEYYVQADCGGGDTSVWSGPFAFNTLLVNDEPCDAIELTVDGPVTQYHNIGGTENGESAITPPVGTCDDNMSWCTDAVANNPVWFKFTAPVNGGAIISTDNAFTDDAGSRTEIALYEVGDCSVYGSFLIAGANTDKVAFSTGSELTLCNLTPGNDYYIMLDGWSDLGAFTPVLGFQGNFGVSVESVASTADAGTSIPIEVCQGDVTPVDLFTSITGNASTTGQWYNPSVALANEYPSTIDISTAPIGDHPFFYVDGSVCAFDTVETTVSVVDGPSAGQDGTVTSCNTTNIFLIQELTGIVEFGGTWNDDDGTGALVNGVFEAYGMAVGTYTFTYTVTSTSTCPDATATVTVTITNCLGLEDESLNVLEVSPSPVKDILTVQNVNINGNFIIEIMDMQGKIVFAESYSGYAGNIEIDMNFVEGGVYFVKLTSDSVTKGVRVVKN